MLKHNKETKIISYKEGNLNFFYMYPEKSARIDIKNTSLYVMDSI